MSITNKDLDDKLEKIYGRINRLFGVTSENGKSIAVLTEHIKNQNSRITKNESRLDGVEGTMTEHDGEIKDIYVVQKNCLGKKKEEESRGWDRNMIKFGGLISVVTGTIVAVAGIIVRLLLGI